MRLLNRFIDPKCAVEVIGWFNYYMENEMQNQPISIHSDFKDAIYREYAESKGEIIVQQFGFGDVAAWRGGRIAKVAMAREAELCRICAHGMATFKSVKLFFDPSEDVFYVLRTDR